MGLNKYKNRSISSGTRDRVTWRFSFYPILSRQIMRHRYATTLPDCSPLTTFVSACFLPIRWQHWKAQPCLCLQSHDNILSLDCFAPSWRSELEWASSFIFSEPGTVIQPTEIWDYLGKAPLFVSRYSLRPFCTSSSSLLHFRRFSSSIGSGHKEITYKQNGEQRKHQYSEHVGDKAVEIIGLPSDVTDRI